jgi:AraC-like DNA-binding protein
MYFRGLRKEIDTIACQFKAHRMQLDLKSAIESWWQRYTVCSCIEGYVGLAFQELLYVLRSFVSPSEMAEIFRPIIGSSLEFRYNVLRNYSSVGGLDELSKALGLTRKTFDVHFVREFGQAPYRWLLQQKAKHVYFSLVETKDTLRDIMDKYGFRIAPHFTRFCRDYFNASPMELRNHPGYSMRVYGKS